MRTLQIIPTYKPAYIYGGTVFCVAFLCENLAKAGCAVKVLTTTANGEKELDVEVGKPKNVDGVEVIYYSRWTKDHSQFSPGLLGGVWRECKKYDVIHIHSWWNISVILSVFICWLRGVKPVLSPHGMLSDFSFNKNHGLIKNYFHRFIGAFLLRQTKMHLTSPAEREQLGGLNENNFVLPNFIKTAPKPILEKTDENNFTLVFLSRIHPKKNIENLIDALSELKNNILLQIIGSGENEYINILKKKAEEKNVADKIEWVGKVHGEKKFDYLANADLFVLPSHNENFALVVAESLSAGTPVLVSENVGLADYVKENKLGWVCQAHTKSIVMAIKSAKANKEQRAIIRKKAPAIIHKDFASSSLSHKYIGQYKKLNQAHA